VCSQRTTNTTYVTAEKVTETSADNAMLERKDVECSRPLVYRPYQSRPTSALFHVEISSATIVAEVIAFRRKGLSAGNEK
jgi:hypothetical protein